MNLRSDASKSSLSLFPAKKCINPCCNSVCRTENIVGYMPQRWQFKGSPNNLIFAEATRHVLWPEKLKEIIFRISTKKKLENDSNIEECSDYQEMPISISWELLRGEQDTFSITGAIPDKPNEYCLDFKYYINFFNSPFYFAITQFMFSC